MVRSLGDCACWTAAGRLLVCVKAVRVRGVFAPNVDGALLSGCVHIMIGGRETGDVTDPPVWYSFVVIDERLFSAGFFFLHLLTSSLLQTQQRNNNVQNGQA